MGESQSVTPVIRPPIHYDSPVVVTGGTGMLGREVVRQLAEGGCPDIRVVDLLAPPGADRGAVRHQRIDLRHDDLTPVVAGAGTVLHLASCQYHSPLAPTTYRLPFFAVNVEGTRRVLEAARRAAVGAFVYVSTSMVYGVPRQIPIREDHPCRPLGPYGRSKLEAERLIAAPPPAGMRTAIVRPPPLFGPGRTGLITRLLDRILAGRPLTVIGGGKNLQELAAPEDCARLVLLAGQGGEQQAVYNCGPASVATMREWITALINEAGSRSVIWAAPPALAKPVFRLLELAHGSPIRREQYGIMDLDVVLDTSTARERLGWVPRWGTVDAALALFRWYRATRGHPPAG
jgi:dTDP-glucose 4,6-dehydratase